MIRTSPFIHCRCISAKSLTGCEGGHTYPTTDIPRYLRLYQSGKLQLHRQITHRFPFDEINKALDTVREGSAGRCLLTMV